MDFAKYIAIFVMVGVLIPQSMEWKPFQFRGSEHMKYSVTQTKDSEIQKGEYTIDIKREDEGYRLELRGEFGGSAGSFSTTVEEAEDIPQALFGQVLFNPWLLPLSITLFSPIFTMYFLNYQQWKGKSHWKQTDEEGNVIEVNFGEECEISGFTGKQLEILVNEKPNYEVCVSEDIPVPLYIKFSEPSENSVFEVKLVEYTQK